MHSQLQLLCFRVEQEIFKEQAISIYQKHKITYNLLTSFSINLGVSWLPDLEPGICSLELNLGAWPSAGRGEGVLTLETGRLCRKVAPQSRALMLEMRSPGYSILSKPLSCVTDTVQDIGATRTTR